MASKLPETITVDGATLTLNVERKRVKNVNARLRGSTLHISAPPGMASKELEAAAQKLARKLLRRAHAQQANAEEDALALASSVAGRFPEPPSVERVMFVANQRSRWGSYSQRTRTIRLNAALRSMPPWVLEAVLAHELAHAIHPDHSPDFWELLRNVYPETERAQAFLAGVSWLGANWKSMPGVELSLLTDTSDE
ncbi:MAG: M48 family metallopeptidase [Rubrobacter sp.]|nr:M48 family metallopeptidase [Rubrobacter sp.]